MLRIEKVMHPTIYDLEHDEGFYDIHNWEPVGKRYRLRNTHIYLDQKVIDGRPVTVLSLGAQQYVWDEDALGKVFGTDHF